MERSSSRNSGEKSPVLQKKPLSLDPGPGLDVQNLGTIKNDPRFVVSNGRQRFVYPLGFCVTRVMRSYIKPRTDTTYTADVRENSETGAPCFVIVADDDKENPVMSDGATDAWEKILQRRLGSALPPTEVRGTWYFGLETASINALVMELSEASETIEKAKKKRERKKPDEVLPDVLTSEVGEAKEAPKPDVESAEKPPKKTRPPKAPPVIAADAPVGQTACPLCKLTTPFCPNTGKMHALGEQPKLEKKRRNPKPKSDETVPAEDKGEQKAPAPKRERKPQKDTGPPAEGTDKPAKRVKTSSGPARENVSEEANNPSVKAKKRNSQVKDTPADDDAEGRVPIVAEPEAPEKIKKAKKEKPERPLQETFPRQHLKDTRKEYDSVKKDVVTEGVHEKRRADLLLRLHWAYLSELEKVVLYEERQKRVPATTEVDPQQEADERNNGIEEQQ